MDPRKTSVTHSGRRNLPDLLERWSFMLPAILLLGATLAYPLLYMVEISFSRFNVATFGAGDWVGWKNYSDVVGDYRFWNSLRVTAIYLIIALPLQIVLGFGIAFLINAEWPGRGVIRALFLIPMVVAPVVAGGMWRIILDPMWGFTNYLLGFVNIGPLDWFGDPVLAMATVIIVDGWRWTPFVVLIATAGILALPKDVIEAARIDGANWWAMLWQVTIPLLTPVIAATFVIRWLGAVKIFDVVMATTRGGPGNSTNVVNLFIYHEAFGSLRFAQSSAMAMIVLVITMALTAFFLHGSRRLEERL